MDGEDLHSARGGLQGATFEAPLFLLGRLQPGEETVEGGAVCGRRELRGHVGEGIEVGSRGGCGVFVPRKHLDIETERPLGLTDQLGQRHTGLGPQLAQRSRQPDDPIADCRGEPLAGRTDPASRGEVFDGLGDADDILGFGREIGQPRRARACVVGVDQRRIGDGALGTGDMESERAGLLTTMLPLPLLGPGVERVEIGDPQPAGRSRQQPHQGVAASGVGDDAKRRQQVDDLGSEQQPTETDDLVGDLRGLQRGHDRGKLRPLAAQHGRRDLGRQTGGGDPPGEVGGLLVLGVQPRHGHRSRTGARPGDQARNRHARPSAQGVGETVGDREDDPVVAPARAQRHNRHRCRAGSELRREPGQRRRARSAPPVDGLMRVADGGHRDRVPVRDKEVAQQDELRFGGVLELVEEDHAVAPPLGRPDIGMPGGQLGGPRDLVGEV